MKKLTPHYILLSILFSSFSLHLFAAKNCDPIAAYPFSGNANDETLNAIHGTAYNTSLTADRNGIPNSAYSFNGTSSYINLGNNPLLKRYQTDFSISAWVYLNAYSSSYSSTIVSNRDQNNIGSSLVISGQASTPGKVGFTVQGGANASTAYSNTVLALNKWYFVSVTYDYQGGNANPTKIYVNGILETTTLLRDVIEPVTTPTYIGFDPSPLVPASYRMNGIIDQVTISNCIVCEPIADYNFSGNANDETVNAINGTVYNASLTADRNGIANSAYSFNGTSSYINLGNNPLLKRYQTDFSISAWVYLNAYSSSYSSTIVSNRDQNNIGSSLVIGGQLSNNANGKVGFTVQGGANASTAYSNTVLALHKWYFVSVTYDYKGGNANPTKIYVNGILETTTLLSDVIEPVTTPTYIGFDPSPLVPADYHMNGIIDEVTISNCFESSSACKPIADYTFSGNANDETFNGINGTVYNASLTADRNGIANSAYSFNGTSSYINLGNNPLLKRYQTDFSISAWVYLNAYSSSYSSTIVSNRDQNNIGSSLVISGQASTPGKVGFTVQGGANASTAYSNTVLALNKWYFVSVTYDYIGGNANPTKIYVNGILETTTLLRDVIEPVTTPTYIGFDPSPLVPASYRMNGIIDQVTISNCLLSDNQIGGTNMQLRTTNTEIQSESNMPQLSVYPNPSTGLFNLEHTLSNPSYEVRSLDGVIVKKGILSSQIDLTSLKSGIYILKVADDNGTAINKKIIIE